MKDNIVGISALCCEVNIYA